MLLLSFTTLIFGHSQMRCAKYNKATGACTAGIRNAGVAFMEESFRPGSTCQAPWTNSISSYYSNGASCPDWAPCPTPMGSYAPGEKFTVMWWARNHAIPEQTPGNVQVYLSSKITSQSSDASATTFMANKPICEGPYANCLNGESKDNTPCTLDCTMPSGLAAGTYTLYWRWAWSQPGNFELFSTCADITVTGSGTAPSPPVTQAPTPAPVTQAPTQAPVTQPPATPAPTPAPARATTGRVPSQGTTGRLMTSGGRTTTGRPTPAPTQTPAPVTQAPSQAPSGGASGCTLGHQRCVSEGGSTYQTCSWKTRTDTDWSAVQSCAKGTSCHAVQGNYIWCY